MKEHNLLLLDQENKIIFKDKAAPILDDLLMFSKELLDGDYDDFGQFNSRLHNQIIRLKIIARETGREIISLVIPEILYLHYQLDIKVHCMTDYKIEHILGIPLKTYINDYHNFKVTIELPHKIELTRICTSENNYRCTYKFNPAY